MARGVNKVILLGNVGNEPELRQIPNGSAVVNFSLATSESWRDKNTGNQETRTEWHRVVAFNRLAEIVGEYVRKGSKIYIEGQLRTRKWDKDGVTQYATEIVASEMQMLDSKGGKQSCGSSSDNYGGNNAPSASQQQGNDAQFDDIPF